MGRYQSLMSILDAAEAEALAARKAVDGDPVLMAYGRALLDLVCDFQYMAENPAAASRCLVRNPDAMDYLVEARRMGIA